MASTNEKEFIAEIEARLGSKLGWRTFATWFGGPGIVREYGVFLATAGGQIYFEDFERLPQILGYTIKSDKTPKYEKYSKTISANDVKAVTRVRKADAAANCRSSSPRALPPAGAFAKAFSQMVTQVEMNDGTIWYFELISHPEFEKALEKAKGDN